jgi:hypothetical protein
MPHLLASSARGPLGVGRPRICKAAKERSEAGERVSRQDHFGMREGIRHPNGRGSNRACPVLPTRAGRIADIVVQLLADGPHGIPRLS